MEFQQTGGFTEEENVVIPKNAICATFTAGDSQMIAETYRRLQKKEEVAAAKHAQALLDRKVVDLLVDLAEQRTDMQVLDQEGVIRINSVLSEELCDSCLRDINAALEMTSDEVSQASNGANGFGNVFERKNRFDMYLRNEGVYQEALASMLRRSSRLGELFNALTLSEPSKFHEFSSLISDPNAASQPIHPDSPYAEEAPLWTVFVALQDIMDDMGPTFFLPKTHTRDCHARLKSLDDKDGLLASCEYHRGLLKKGDCAVMDSRTFHFGTANDSEKRRVLLYFTVRNPRHGGDYPPNGSLLAELSEMTTSDFYL